MPGFLRDWGYELQEAMLTASQAVTRDGDLRAAFPAVAVAVLFGIVHIIGPGHGKLFTIGYFGSRRARLSEGIVLSALVNILDSLSAFLLVGITWGILSVSLRSTGAKADQIVRLVAYSAIVILGLSHLFMHTRSHRHAPDESKESIFRPWMLALAVGLVPCPVSSAILAWGIVNQALGFSLILVAGVSLGGMTAMTAFSLVLIGGKRGLTQMFERRGFHRALEIVETIFIVLLILVGILLLVSVL